MGRIICEDLTVRRGRFTLRVPGLTLLPGEKVALLGENGCGKTTLLQLLAGLASPDEGRIEVAGRLWNRLSAAQRAEQMAYLPQEAGLLFNLTVEELVDLSLDGEGLLRGPGREEAVAATEMGEYLSRVYQTLSGGEKRRAMLLRIFCRRRPFTLLDEPTAPLDLRHGLAVMRHLRRLEGAVVAALHDLNLALSFFDRFLLMKSGRILFDVPKAELEKEMLETTYDLSLDSFGGFYWPRL